MKYKARLFTLLAVSALATAGLAPLSTAPAWAVGCYASSCTFQDPINEGCANAGAVTIYQKTGVGRWGHGILQLRYNTTCAAAWAKVYDDGSSSGDSIWIQNTQGWIESLGVSSDGSEYTDMLDDLGSIQSRACIEASGSNNPTCTAWF